MKAYISLAALFAVAFIGCTKEPMPEYRIVYYPNKKNVKEEWSIVRTPRGDTLEQGTHKHYFWDGAVAQSEIWKQGKREGTALAWYENATPKWQRKFEGGMRQGMWRLFYKDGNPWLVANYDKDLLNGPVHVYDKQDSTMKKEAIFTAGNCVSGDCTLLEFAPAPVDTAAKVNIEQANEREILEDFLN
jgi:hypothetical protein